MVRMILVNIVGFYIDFKSLTFI